MEFLKKNITTIIILLIALGGLVWYFSSKGDRAETALLNAPATAITTSGPGGLTTLTPIGATVAGEGSLADQIGVDIIQILSQLDGIKLDIGLFRSPSFTLLQQSNEVIPAPVPRRSNPFAPIGSRTTGTAAPTTGTSTQATN